VVIAHSGLEGDPDRPRRQPPADAEGDIPNENAILGLADAHPEIDVILFGHTHQELPEKIVNGVLLAQARNWGQSLARADIEMKRGADGRWSVASKKSTVLPVTRDVAADPEITRLVQPYHDEVQKYLDTPLGSSEKELDGGTGRYEDHPLVDFIHRAQLKAGKADVSLATMFIPGARIPAGTVTIRHMFYLYPYENSLYTVQMSGAQLAGALEHAAGFFPDWPAQGGHLRLPGYNADNAEGVEYELDLTQPRGQRVRGLRFRGQPLAPSATLRVAINHYRYAGGGRYRAFEGLPIVYSSKNEVRELMIAFMKRSRVLPAAANGNWKILPREAVDALIRESRPREPRPATGP